MTGGARLGDDLRAIASHLARRRSEILRRWHALVEADEALTTSSAISRAQFYDHIPHALEAFERRLCATSAADKDEANADQKESAAEHGLQRWQQGYNQLETMREWAHLHLCVLDELERYAVDHRDVDAEVLRISRRALARLCGDGVCESAARYSRMQQAEAASAKTDMLWETQQKELKEAKEKAVAAAQSEYSLAGRLGHGMEPILKPLGFDWKMGVGLVGAFAAREVFVSTMGIIYSVGEVEGPETKDLANAMRQDRYANGKPVWSPLVAVSLLVWFVLAMQCMSTVAIVRRETGGWGWPIFMILYMNGLAYTACLLVFQVGRVVLRV